MGEKDNRAVGTCFFCVRIGREIGAERREQAPGLRVGDVVGVTMRADTIRPYEMGQIDFVQWSYGRDDGQLTQTGYRAEGES